MTPFSAELILFPRFFHFRRGDRLGAARFEFFNPPSGVDKLYLACVGRMALGANFNPDFWFCCVHRESIAAGTNDLGVPKIRRMDVFFHGEMIVGLFLRKVKSCKLQIFRILRHILC